MSWQKPTLDDLRIDRGSAPASRAPFWAPLAVLAVVVVLGVGVWWWVRPGAIAVQTVAAREPAASGDDRTVLNASGYVTARREATVSSKVTGRVVDLLIEEGMKVKEGQVLARLDDSNTRTSLDVAKAQLDSARTAVDETRALLQDADRDYARATNLMNQKIIAQSDLDKAESNDRSLAARLARQVREISVAEATVAMFQQQMEDLEIRAPFDGVITTKDAQPGEMISPVSAGGGFTRTGIGTVVDMNSLEIEIDVNENYINRVQPGQPVEATLDAYPDWKIPCKVIAIIPTADRQKSTVKVRVGFDHLDPRILPEMSAKVAFRETGGAGASREAIVPKTAIRNSDGRDIVFVVENGRAERRAVTVASAEENDARLSAGISAGDRVVADPPAGLADGAAVKETPISP